MEADVAVVFAFGGGAGEQVHGQEQRIGLTWVGGGAFGDPPGVSLGRGVAALARARGSHTPSGSAAAKRPAPASAPGGRPASNASERCRTPWGSWPRHRTAVRPCTRIPSRRRR